MTIKNYSDHAANERTFLAWVRTSIAVTAFGFLVERFDLFLSLAASTALDRRITVSRPEFGRIAGLVLIVAGVVMVVLASVRFVKTAKEIDAASVMPGTGSRLDIALTAMLAVLGIALFLYLSHAVTAKA
jgi:putative membrane protein